MYYYCYHYLFGKRKMFKYYYHSINWTYMYRIKVTTGMQDTGRVNCDSMHPVQFRWDSVQEWFHFNYLHYVAIGVCMI